MSTEYDKNFQIESLITKTALIKAKNRCEKSQKISGILGEKKYQKLVKTKKSSFIIFKRKKNRKIQMIFDVEN